MDMKNLSFKQICWAQKLSQYHFQINYYSNNANAATNALSRFLQKSQDKKDELQAKNGQIFHCLQNSLTNTSLAGLSFPSFFLLHLHQILICGTYDLPQLYYFWDNLQKKLAFKGLYKVSINGIKLRLQKL